jgi:hypothetical protein
MMKEFSREGAGKVVLGWKVQFSLDEGGKCLQLCRRVRAMCLAYISRKPGPSLLLCAVSVVSTGLWCREM